MFKNIAIAALIGSVSAIDNEFKLHEVNLNSLQTNAVQVSAVKKHHHHHNLAQRQEQEQENPYGRTHVERMLNSTYTYEPDLKAAVARQEAQEEAFKVPSIRAINAQKDAQQALYQRNPFGQVASPVAGVFSYQYDPEVKAAVAKQEGQEEAFAVPSVRAINGKGPGAKYEAPAATTTTLAQHERNPFGQVASPVAGVFSYQYDPEVKAAVAKQEGQEEAFAVPSVRAINGKGPGAKYEAPSTTTTSTR